MTTENALAIAGHAVLTRIVRVRSEVFVVGTDRGGGTAARLEVADEHVDDRFTQFLPAESDTQHSSRFVEPIKAVGRADVQDDDRARICRRHGSDQRRLTAGKFPQIPIATLRLPVVVGPDDNDGNVAFRGQGRRFADEITFDNGLAADDQACQQDGPLIGELDLDGDGLAGFEVDVGRHLDRSEAEEGIAALDIGALASMMVSPFTRRTARPDSVRVKRWAPEASGMIVAVTRHSSVQTRPQGQASRTRADECWVAR